MDDEVSMLRLGGWVLFSCIDYRERAIKNKTKIKHTADKLQSYSTELRVLQSLVDVEKKTLPIGITAQDRGSMTFPKYSLLHYIQFANKILMDHLCTERYEKYGSELLKVI